MPVVKIIGDNNTTDVVYNSDNSTIEKTTSSSASSASDPVGYPDEVVGQVFYSTAYDPVNTVTLVVKITFSATKLTLVVYEDYAMTVIRDTQEFLREDFSYNSATRTTTSDISHDTVQYLVPAASIGQYTSEQVTMIYSADFSSFTSILTHMGVDASEVALYGAMLTGAGYVINQGPPITVAMPLKTYTLTVPTESSPEPEPEPAPEPEPEPVDASASDVTIASIVATGNTSMTIECSYSGSQTLMGWVANCYFVSAAEVVAATTDFSVLGATEGFHATAFMGGSPPLTLVPGVDPLGTLIGMTPRVETEFAAGEYNVFVSCFWGLTAADSTGVTWSGTITIA